MSKFNVGDKVVMISPVGNRDGVVTEVRYRNKEYPIKVTFDDGSVHVFTSEGQFITGDVVELYKVEE